MYGAAAIDNDGRGLCSTGFGHGDALHVGDFVPDNPGLEIGDIQAQSSGFIPTLELREVRLFDAQGRRVGRGYLEMTGYAAPLRLAP